MIFIIQKIDCHEESVDRWCCIMGRNASVNQVGSTAIKIGMSERA